MGSDLEKVRSAIAQSRNAFLYEHVRPFGLPYVRDIIAESWLRSEAFGVNPHADPLPIAYEGK